MLARRTVLGCVPALLKMSVARRLSILHFDKAAARVKPPIRSIMTGDHMEAKMADVASLEVRRLEGLLGSSSRTTLRTTAKKGINRDVTNRGIVCVGELVSRKD